MPIAPDLPKLAARLPPWTQALLEVLTDRERTAVILRETAMTLEQIGVELDVSARRAHQIVKHATEKMVNAAQRGVLLHLRVPAAGPHDPRACYQAPCAVPAELRGALDLPVGVLGLDRKALRSLESAEVGYVGQLVVRRESQVLGIWNLGRNTLRQINEALAALGLHLGMDVGDWLPPVTEADAGAR